MAKDPKGIKFTEEDQRALERYQSTLEDFTDKQLEREKELAEVRAESARAQLEASIEDDKTRKKAMREVDAFIAKERELADLKAAGLEGEQEYLDLQKKIADRAEKGFSEEQKRYIAAKRNQRALLDIEKERAEVLEYQKKVLDTLNTIGQEISGISFKNFASFGSFASMAMEMAHALDQANAELAKMTGYARALAPDLTRLAQNNHDIAVTMTVAKEAVAGLNSSMSLFGAVSAHTRHVIEDFAVVLGAMGVKSEDFGKSLDVLTRGMGISAPAAATTAAEFDRLAQSLGLPTAQVLSDFAEMGPELAAFGVKGRKVFADLQKEARGLGVEIKSAFDLARTFDSFTEGAELAAQLNAQLGTQINNVSLMMEQDMSKRLEIIRKDFRALGRGFEDLQYLEIRALEGILGMDATEVRKFLSNPVAFQRFQKEQKQMRERAQLMTAAMDKFKASVENLFMQMEPLLTKIMEIANFLAEWGIPQFIMVGLIFKAALIPMFKALLLGSSKLLPALAGVAAKLGIVATTSPAAAGGLGSFAAICGASTVKVLALAKAMIYLGVGFGALAAGFGVALHGAAALVKSFKGLGDSSAVALLGLTLFTIGMIVFAAILVKAAPLLAGASGALYIFAGGLAAVGIAIGIIAAGFGYMITSVAKVIEMIGKGVMGNAIEGIVSLTDALETMGKTILGLEENNSLKSLSMTVDQLVRLEPVAKEGQAGAEFFNALARTVEVTANLTPAQIENIQTVTSQMVRVTGEVNAGNTARLDAIANAVRANGSRREEHIPVKLMLKNQVLGDAVLKYVREAAHLPGDR